MPKRLLALAALLGAPRGALGAAVVEEGKDLGGGWQEKKKDGRVVQELKLEAPAMTEEDQYGYVMPDRYRCDSCRAIMFHLDAALRNRHPKSRRMKAWEYTDLLDDTCKTGFKGYGIKLVDGQNALSGPALKNEALSPGSGAIQMGGENWEKRLGELCRKIVYEKVGEDEIYEAFYKKFRAEQTGEENPDGGLSEGLCRSPEVRDCGALGPKLPPPKEEAKEDKKKKKPKTTKSDKGDKKKKPPSSKEPTSPARASADATEPRVDVQSFLRSLAVKHGLTAEEYLTARTPREWEKLTVAMAGRIFNRMSEEEGSCAAN